LIVRETLNRLLKTHLTRKKRRRRIRPPFH